MGLLRELQRHNVHWFLAVAILLYLIAFATGVRPLHVDQLPHTEIVHERELRGFGGYRPF